MRRMSHAMLMAVLAACTDGNPARDAIDRARASEAQPAARPYFCPMHPDVEAAEPGTCPHCGMALVERET